MPKQGTRSQTTYPAHVEQVRQTKDAKGDLVFTTGSDWTGDDATDSVIMAAEPDNWVYAEEWR